VSQTLAQRGGPLRYNQLRQEIMQRNQRSKRTAQFATTQAVEKGEICQRPASMLCLCLARTSRLSVEAPKGDEGMLRSGD